MVHTLPGNKADETYRIWLGGAVDDPTAEVVLVTDADNQFAPLREVYAALRREMAVRPLVLVGVGYGGGYESPINRRMRDYTPSTMPDEPGTGGAAAFLTWVNGTLRPWLAARGYRAGGWGVAGHSLGSLWGLYAFFEDTAGFDACLASAPSIWFDDRMLLGLVAQHRASDAHRSGRLVLSVGEGDSPSMTGDLALLEAQLAAEPFAGLDVTSQRFAGYDHYNVLPAAFRAGLQALYPAG